MTPTVFDFVNSINNKTENLIAADPDCEKIYVPFIVNKAFSQHQDSVLSANEMNVMHFLDKRMQYDFLMGCIKKRKRFGKWVKPEWNEEQELVLCEYYGISRLRAREYLKMMTEQDWEILKEKTNKGGSNPHK